MLRHASSLALALAATLSACNTDHSPIETPVAAAVAPVAPALAAGETPVPKVHTFPPGRGAEIRKLFSASAMSYPISVVSSAGTNTQFVQPKPLFVGTDRFVATMPPSFQVQLDQLIADMAKSPPAASSTYEVTYWVIEADAATATEVPADLTELAPTLDAITGLGKRRFKSIDRVAARTLDGERSALKGRVIQLEAKMEVDPEGLRLQINDMTLRGTWADAPGQGPSLQTTLELKPESPIVLGDSTLASESSGVANLLLYVVRARRVD